MPDLFKQLQAVARAAAKHINPDSRPRAVIVLGPESEQILSLQVPAACDPERPAAAGAVSPGWRVTETGAFFEGRPVPVTGRKLDVLRLLVARDVVPLAELRAAWEGYQVEDSTVRWTVGELKKVLKEAFPDFPGETIVATGEGYSLAVR